MINLSQDLLKEFFEYKDGFLYWKVKRKPQINIGDRAGTLHKYKSGDRYSVGISGKTYLNARLIFLFHYGYLPVEVDHKDRNQLNDKIENLRPASKHENMRNISSRKNSSSKYLGVCREKRYNKWYANIYIDGKLKFLGSFETEEQAALAYNEAAKVHYKEFANLNIINN